MRKSLLMIPVVALFAGCYNPDLGETPFKCAVDTPRCPNGYECYNGICAQTEPADQGIPDKTILDDTARLPSKEGPVYLDGAHVQPAGACDDSDNEPNNTAVDATLLPEGLSTGWEICYKFDVDQYKIQLKKGYTLEVEVKFTASKGDLDAAITDPAGWEAAVSRGTTGSEKLQVKAQQDGYYILGVWGFVTGTSAATNTYSLDVKITQ